jgi:putative transposase
MAAALELAHEVGVSRTTEALGVARAGFYRAREPRVAIAAPRPRPSPPRTLGPAERGTVLELLNSERFVDRAPKAVYAELLDEDGTYLCSWRTMYRILAAAQEVRERRNQLRHPAYAKPELLATGPNQVWSWDITKLRGPVKWTYYYLYVILDIFSRYAVGWMVAEQENATLAEHLIDATCEKQAIRPGQLTLHADRGAPMTAKTVAELMVDLGVQQSHSRPHVSDDNPYSEAQFKTVKNHPTFPDRFGAIQDARGFSRQLFAWYNTEHRHEGLGLLTPEAVHYGRAPEIIDRRRAVLAAAYARHPERFVKRAPEPLTPPAAVWINPPPKTAGATQEGAH